MVAAVPDREDIGIGAARMFVDNDAIVDRETAVLRELHVRDLADAGKDEVGGDDLVLGVHGNDGGAGGIGLDAPHRGAGAYGDSGVVMNLLVEGGYLGGGHARQQARQRFEDRHFEAAPSRHGRDFETHVAAADDDEARPRMQELPDG